MGEYTIYFSETWRWVGIDAGWQKKQCVCKTLWIF